MFIQKTQERCIILNWGLCNLKIPKIIQFKKTNVYKYMRQKVQPYKGYNVIDVRVTVCSPAKKKKMY